MSPPNPLNPPNPLIPPSPLNPLSPPSPSHPPNPCPHPLNLRFKDSLTNLCILKMLGNAVQYRVTVGIFNNRKLIINLRFELPSCSKLSNNLPNYDASFISLLFYIFLIAFLFSKGYVSKISRKLYISIFLLFNILLGVLVWLCSCLIILSGDVEVNPGPKNSVSECLSICDWNLNSILAHDYSKLFLLKAYISVHKFDIICLSETYLDSTVPLDDVNLVISGYNLIRSDHPSNTKRGGVCLYYKNYLPLTVLNTRTLSLRLAIHPVTL